MGRFALAMMAKTVRHSNFSFPDFRSVRIVLFLARDMPTQVSSKFQHPNSKAAPKLKLQKLQKEPVLLSLAEFSEARIVGFGAWVFVSWSLAPVSTSETDIVICCPEIGGWLRG